MTDHCIIDKSLTVRQTDDRILPTSVRRSSVLIIDCSELSSHSLTGSPTHPAY